MTKNIYRILHKGLKKLHPYEAKGNEARHLNTLTSFIFGIIKSSKVTLSEIASEIPNSGKKFNNEVKTLGS